MRGNDGRSGSLFSYVDLEARVPRGHPLRVHDGPGRAAVPQKRGQGCGGGYARRPRASARHDGGADKGYDTKGFVMEPPDLGITPHVAQNAHDTGKARRRSAIDGRTTRHPG
jgi:hypothetical protein